jgi:hypothetical protein
MRFAFFVGIEMSNETGQEDQNAPKQPFADFLESTPPNQRCHIADVAVKRRIPGGGMGYFVKAPEIQIHCSEQTCNGIRFFRCTKGHDTYISEESLTTCYLTYTCSNCQISEKIFALAALRDEDEVYGTVYKFGEAPVFGPPVPAKLLKLIGEDRETFLKGRRCENQGLGVGAYTYYRRVVENQKNRIFKEIIKVSEKIGACAEKIKLLTAALNETQFSKALDMAKDALPESLLISGHNPLRLLYKALSEGVHNLSDEDCLADASSVRVILAELSDRLAQALKDEAEIATAIARLGAIKPRTS